MKTFEQNKVDIGRCVFVCVSCRTYVYGAAHPFTAKNLFFLYIFRLSACIAIKLQPAIREIEERNNGKSHPIENIVLILVIRLNQFSMSKH